jgi:hypothetical protein
MPAAVFLTLMLAQDLPAEAADAAKMERLRKALAETPAIVLTPPLSSEGPVFRVTIHGPRPDPPVWDAWSTVPSYIRPPMRLYSHEFMERVTPEIFRAQTLYPLGVPVVPLLGFVGKQIGTAQRRAAEGRARDEVRRALEVFAACRTGPASVGCEPWRRFDDLSGGLLSRRLRPSCARDRLTSRG